jgi:hypothetical protein
MFEIFFGVIHSSLFEFCPSCVDLHLLSEQALVSIRSPPSTFGSRFSNQIRGWYGAHRNFFVDDQSFPFRQKCQRLLILYLNSNLSQFH